MRLHCRGDWSRTVASDRKRPFGRILAGELSDQAPAMAISKMQRSANPASGAPRTRLTDKPQLAATKSLRIQLKTTLSSEAMPSMNWVRTRATKRVAKSEEPQNEG
jgi:hypothetical protein